MKIKTLISASLLTIFFNSYAEIPKAQEEWFALTEAKNLAAVEKKFGIFNAKQRAFLEKHRFLLVPRKNLDNEVDSDDEMLAAFDSMVEPFSYYDYDEKNQHKSKFDAAGARLFNPDIFQHALHMYFYRRMRFLEEKNLAPALENMLGNLITVALKEEYGAEEKLVAAELLVPYVMLKTAMQGSGKILTNEDGIPSDNQDTKADTLEAALTALKPYKISLGEQLSQAAEQELTKIFKAEGKEKSAFSGWASPNMAKIELDPDAKFEIDYTAFKPRGYYVNNATLRGWFRAMIWLGQSGFNLENESGLRSALIFAALLENSPNATKKDSKENEEWNPNPINEELVNLSPKEAMEKIMDITALFHGLPDTATPKEWLKFLEENFNGKLALEKANSPETMEKVKNSLKNLKVGNNLFAGLRKEEETKILSLFPSRFTLPYFIADELTYKNIKEKKDLPVKFSSLFVAAALGNEYAINNLLPQTAYSWRRCKDADNKLTVLECNPVDTNEITTNALKREMQILANKMAKLKDSDWNSSIATGRLKLLTTLTSTFGEGYPLYMQDKLFSAKQLESLLGAYTELKYDTVLYEKPNYAELGDGGEDIENIPPISFVEPNLAFWQELKSQVELIEKVFTENKLFLNDLEEYGTLNRFKENVNFCLKIAQKELAGERLSVEEIKELHQMSLSYMASPMGNAVITPEEWLSGLIVDIQTVPSGDFDGITYEALGTPYYIFALVGSGKDKRIVGGLAYNHYEFTTPYGERLNDNDWKPKAYGGVERPYAEELLPVVPLPKKNFWYQDLLVK